MKNKNTREKSLGYFKKVAIAGAALAFSFIGFLSAPKETDYEIKSLSPIMTIEQTCNSKKYCKLERVIKNDEFFIWNENKENYEILKIREIKKYISKEDYNVIKWLPQIYRTLKKIPTILSNEEDPYLALALLNQESKGNQYAESSRGAKGLMQLMPKTAKAFGTKNLFNPIENIYGGLNYLSWIVNEYLAEEHPHYEKLNSEEVLKLGLAGYNWGAGNLKKNGWNLDNKKVPAETKYFAPEILKNIEEYSTKYEDILRKVKEDPTIKF